MITKDQPTIFSSSVTAAVSSVSDGNMRYGRGNDDETLKNRETFLKNIGLAPENTSVVRVTYDTEDFARYHILTDDQAPTGILPRNNANLPVDALVVTQPGHALFLAPADCAGVVIHDERQHILMLSHVGRHSAEIDGATKSINYLKEQFHTSPADVKVWLSPAVGPDTYPILKKESKGLHQLILEQLKVAGVPRANIEVSTIDTAKDPNYFSHSEFKAGKRDFDGRFAVVAALRG